jgi:hypothetical protein
MLRYVFAWAPAVVVFGTAVILSSAYLALIVLILAAAVALSLLAGAVVAAPYFLVRGLYRRWPGISARDDLPESNAHEPTWRT